MGMPEISISFWPTVSGWQVPQAPVATPQTQTEQRSGSPYRTQQGLFSLESAEANQSRHQQTARLLG